MLASGAAFACYCKGAAYAGADAAPVESEEAEGDDEGPRAHKGPPCPCRNLSDADRSAKK